MRADRASRAATVAATVASTAAQLELHVSDGSGAGASVADSGRLLREIRLAADDVGHDDQLGRNQSRHFPMRSTLSWPHTARS